MAALRASASEIGRPGLQNRVAGSLVQLFVPVAGLAPATHVSATHGSWTDQKAGRPGQAHSCPVHFLLYIAHGIDSTGPGLLGNDPDMSWGSMPCAITIAFFISC